VGFGDWVHKTTRQGFWSAVAQMQGASLHRSYRFLGVKKALRAETTLQPA
jgi:hypothetical protein